MKVILVSPYSDHLVGGIFNRTRYIVNHHREHNEDIDLQFPNNQNAILVMSATGPMKRLISSLGNNLSVCRQFNNKVAEGYIDVAHICTCGTQRLDTRLVIYEGCLEKGC